MQTERKYWRRKDYTGRYTGSVRPATWQENMDSLLAGLASAQRENNPSRITICERTIAAHQSKDPETYNRSLGLCCK